MDIIKIGLVGVLHTKQSSNVKLLESFKKKGNIQIFPLDYRVEMTNDFKNFHDKLETLAKYVDVAIICKGNGISIGTIQAMKQHCKIFHYFMDPFTTMKAHNNLLEMSKICDWRSATGKEIAQLWEDAIQLPVWHVVDGCDVDIYYKETSQKLYDVTFIGSMDEERLIIKKTLERNGIICNFVGPGFTEFVKENEFRRLCNQSKILLNVSRGQYYGYSSLRLWNYLACGTMVLTKQINGIEKTLKLIPGTHLDEFSTMVELIDKINYYLNNETERETIAKQGMEHVRTHHTWDQTTDQIISIIEGN